ncbi:oligosaccharide flippase family protein, partial [Candidatus Roizmanbacteria bacterium]|nr:oligosaccharide flippase family protein [Candidatus Roizmanbacteria bacterium]
MVRDLFKNTGIYFFGSVLSKAITTIAWIALARLLTPEKYGQFTLYFMILQMTTFLGDFGLNQWYLRNVEKENRTLIFNKIIYVRSLTLFLTIAILSFILFYFKIFDLTSSL